jgi:peroxiredoxin
MSVPNKLQAGAEFPAFTLPKVGGGEIKVGGPGRWQMLVVYRGQHCPICRTYLKTLGGLLDEYRAADIDVVVASSDSREKAEKEAAEEGWTFPTGYGLSLDQMRRLGLYISNPRPSPPDTDTQFSEPGLFVINPRGEAHVIDVSNQPFARPDLKQVLNGIRYARERNFPVRGTAD